jgi:hypothetical protein
MEAAVHGGGIRNDGKVNMARKGRGLLITLCVIVGIVVVAAVGARLLLTRERLLAIVIPRVEKAIDAKVSIGDIGINFPFGLGVDIEELSFEKTLPDTSALTFTSDKVTVRSSLMSLLRRKPEIKAADVQGGAVTVIDAKKGREIELRGIGAHISMNPPDETFTLSAKLLVDSALVSSIGAPPAVMLEKIGFDGGVEGDRALTRLVVKGSKLSWGDVVAAKISGEATNVKTDPRVTLTVESDERPIAPLLEKIRTFRPGDLAQHKPAAAAASRPAQSPVEISGGTFRFTGRIEGLAKEPLSMSIDFEGALRGASVRAGDLASIEKMDASVKGKGVALAWQRLFPDPEKPISPAEISVAWQAVELNASIDVEGGEFVVQSAPAAGAHGEVSSGAAGAASGGGTGSAAPPPVRISALKARAEISGPDVKKLSGDFMIGGSPYRFSGSMTNVLPASAEIALIARKLEAAGQKQTPELGTILDRMVNAPVVKFELSGRSFDARPYQKPLFGPSGGPAGTAAQAAAPAATQPAAGTSAAALIFLKNTTFTAKLDSVIAREAVVTSLEAKGTIRDGRIRIDPVTFAYAGGKGSAIVTADARGPRVETKIDLTADGIEADRALERISPHGDMVRGTFSIKSNGTLATGPGIKPLMAFSAAGSALSTKGSVTIGNFLEPLSKIPGFDVTPFKEFNFSDWKGTFVVKDGRFITDDWKIASARGDWAIKGSFGFDGTLDYAVHLVIPPAVQAQMKDLDRYKAAFDLMRDASGALVLDIHVGGTAKHPSAALDLSKAKSKAQERAIEGLKKLLK